MVEFKGKIKRDYPYLEDKLDEMLEAASEKCLEDQSELEFLDES